MESLEKQFVNCLNVSPAKHVEFNHSTLPRRSKKKESPRRLSSVDSAVVKKAIKSSKAFSGSLDRLDNGVGTTKRIRRKDVEQLHYFLRLWLSRSSLLKEEEEYALHLMKNYDPSSYHSSPESSLGHDNIEPLPSISPPLCLSSVNADAPTLIEDSEFSYGVENRLPTLSCCDCCVKPEPQSGLQQLLAALLQGTSLSSFHHPCSTVDSPPSSVQPETLSLLSSGDNPTSSLSYLQLSERELCATHRHGSQELVMGRCRIPCIKEAEAVFPPLGLYAKMDKHAFAILSSLSNDSASESSIS